MTSNLYAGGIEFKSLPDIIYPEKYIAVFLIPPQRNVGITLQIKSVLLPSISARIHYSYFVLSFDGKIIDLAIDSVVEESEKQQVNKNT
jgi:hypothetical protein